MKHVPKISSTHFTPKQTPNLQSPLKTSCPPPKFNFRPFSKWMIPFWCVSAYLSRARNLINFQRVNLQQAEAPPFRFTGPQTSCTEVETKNVWKSGQTNNKHLNSINFFSKMKVSREKNGGFLWGIHMSYDVMTSHHLFTRQGVPGERTTPTWKKRPAAMRAACIALMLGSKLPTLSGCWIHLCGWIFWDQQITHP